MAAEELRADPLALQLGCNRVFGAVGEAAVDFVGHDDGLARATPGWIGASQQALVELAARWEMRRGRHTRGVAGLGHGVADAAVGYATGEGESAQALESVLAKLGAPGC